MTSFKCTLYLIPIVKIIYLCWYFHINMLLQYKIIRYQTSKQTCNLAIVLIYRFMKFYCGLLRRVIPAKQDMHTFSTNPGSSFLKFMWCRQIMFFLDFITLMEKPRKRLVPLIEPFVVFSLKNICYVTLE